MILIFQGAQSRVATNQFTVEENTFLKNLVVHYRVHYLHGIQYLNIEIDISFQEYLVALRNAKNEICDLTDIQELKRGCTSND